MTNRINRAIQLLDGTRRFTMTAPISGMSSPMPGAEDAPTWADT